MIIVHQGSFSFFFCFLYKSRFLFLFLFLRLNSRIIVIIPSIIILSSMSRHNCQHRPWTYFPRFSPIPSHTFPNRVFPRPSLIVANCFSIKQFRCGGGSISVDDQIQCFLGQPLSLSLENIAKYSPRKTRSRNMKELVVRTETWRKNKKIRSKVYAEYDVHRK